MTDSLAVREKEERATGCTTLADLGTYVDTCTDMDGEVLGEYIERNWNPAVGNTPGVMFLVKEMKRRFKLLDRKKQVNGEYKTIRGYTSFDKWFTSFTGESRRLAYYLLETEEKKNERNAGRRTSEKKKDTDYATFAARCGDAKKKLAEIQRQLSTVQDVKPLYEQINPTIDEVFQEFLALISPEGYEVTLADRGWNVTKKDEDKPEPPSPEEKKAKRSAAAKKAMATKAANKAAAQPATSLGECEGCCDGTLATEVVGVTDFSPEGYKYCVKCADGHRRDDPQPRDQRLRAC